MATSDNASILAPVLVVRAATSFKPFLLCDDADMDQSVGRRNDPVSVLIEAGE